MQQLSLPELSMRFLTAEKRKLAGEVLAVVGELTSAKS